MKEITLNGKLMASESSAQEYLFDVFDFPEYYGNDLEGFYDALTDITEETHVKMPPVTMTICRWPGQK